MNELMVNLNIYIEKLEGETDEQTLRRLSNLLYSSLSGNIGIGTMTKITRGGKWILNSIIYLKTIDR